jgi:hypothetical protein
MRKLTLESLLVDSFETTASVPGTRGTVQGHAEAITGSRCPSYDPCASVNVVCHPQTEYTVCRETEYMDCTYGCTRLYNTCGGNYCWIDNTGACTS